MQNQNVLLYLPYILILLMLVFFLYSNRKLKKKIKTTESSVRVLNYMLAGLHRVLTGQSTTEVTLDPLSEPSPSTKLPLTEELLLDAAEYEFSSHLPHTSYETWHDKCRELLPYPDEVDPSLRAIYTDFVRKVAGQWKAESMLPKRELAYLDQYVQVSGASPQEIRNEISVYKQVFTGERDFQYTNAKDLSQKIDAYFRHIKKEHRALLQKQITKNKKKPSKT